jgi:signal transduction histidine kinase
MRRRIVICLALLLALYVIGDATALWCLQRSTEQLSALAESQRIQVMRANLAASGVRIQRDLLAAHRQADGAESLRHDSIDRFRQAIDHCGDCHHVAPVQAKLDEIRATFDAYVATVTRLIDAPASGAHDLELEAEQFADRLVMQATEAADRAYHHLETRGTDAVASIRNVWIILCGTLVAAMLAGGVVALHLHRRVTGPVEALLAGVRRVRDGDVGECLNVKSDGEFHALAEAFTHAYADLSAAQERVLQAEKMAAVGKLAAGVAHEVGNPLASISSVAQIMRRRCADPDQLEKLDLIMQHINRASRIVRELLAFSRPVYDRKLGEVEISAVLDRAVSLLRYDRRAGNAAIECRYPAGLRVQRGDADRLMTVFTNVMINAFDAIAPCRPLTRRSPLRGQMPQACGEATATSQGGDARLMIRAEQTADRVIIAFEDNGPGMTKDELRNACEPFFTTKEPGAGTGLGLWVCYQVVQKHGGTIRLENRSAAGQAAQGTRVVIELPSNGRA